MQASIVFSKGAFGWVSFIAWDRFEPEETSPFGIIGKLFDLKFCTNPGTVGQCVFVCKHCVECVGAVLRPLPEIVERQKAREDLCEFSI